MALGQILSVGGSLLGGLFGKNAAEKAAETQANVAANQLGIEANIYNANTKRLRPFVNAGTNAQRILNYYQGHGEKPVFGGTAPEIVEFTDAPQPAPAPANALGFPGADPYSRSQNALGTPTPITQAEPASKFRVNDQVFNTREAAQKYANANKTGGTEYQGFRETPGYQFQFDQGVKAIDSSAASRGSLFSGATMKAQNTFGTGLADQEFTDHYNRLAAQAHSGQAAAGQQANIGNNFAAGTSNALGGYGNAVSAGQIGGFNALSQGVNNAVGVFNYQNNLANQGQKNNGGIFGGLFG